MSPIRPHPVAVPSPVSAAGIEPPRRSGDAPRPPYAASWGRRRPVGGAASDRPDRQHQTRPVDPVRELIECHRALCEQAVDPLEIAVALEESGIDSSVASRYRHADVFGLAEELFARVPRRPPEPAPPPVTDRWTQRLGAALRSAQLHLLPVTALLLIHLAAPSAGLPALVLAAVWLAWAAPCGELAARIGYGAGVALLLGSPAVLDHSVPTALALAAALGVGSAEWSARWLGRAGRAQLASTTTLAAFRSRMRPALPVAAAVHLAVLAVLSSVTLAVITALARAPVADGLVHGVVHAASGREWAGQAVLGLLLLLVTVLLHRGRTVQAVAAVLAAGAGEGALWPLLGTTAPLVACGLVVVALSPYTVAVLGRAGSYRSRITAFD